MVSATVGRSATSAKSPKKSTRTSADLGRAGGEGDEIWRVELSAVGMGRRSVMGAAAFVLVLAAACSSSSKGAGQDAVPLCSDLFRQGTSLTDAQWQAGCRLNGTAGVTPAQYKCFDGRNFFSFPTRAWGYGGEQVHLISGNLSTDPDGQREFDRCGTDASSSEGS